MEQAFIEQIIKNYDHLHGKYLGCFCKDEMDKLSSAIGEHWMGTITNRQSNASGYFDSFGRSFPWLINTLKEHSKTVHKTRHVVQAESVSTCGLHSLYFIIRMMDPLNKASYVTNFNVGEYVHVHYDMKEGDTILKDKDIVHYISKKFKTNFSMLLRK